MQFISASITSGYHTSITDGFGDVCQASDMPTDPKTPYERIQARMREKWPKKWPEGKKIPQRAVAELMGVSQPSAHKWMHGGEMDMETAKHCALKIDVCVEWLLTGRGDKFPLTSPDSLLQEIIQATLALSDPQRMELLNYARYVSSGFPVNRPVSSKVKTG